MAPNAADRYPDAGAFRDALHALDAPVDPEAATAVVALPLPANGPPSFSIGNWRILALGGGLAAGLLILVVSAAPAGLTRTEQAVAGGAGLEVIPMATPAPTTVEPTSAPTPRGNHGTEHGNGKGKGR